MSSLNFQISPEVVDQFPEIMVSAIRIKGLKSAAASLDAAGLVNLSAQKLAKDFSTPEVLVADPRIDAWRKAYGKIEAKPSKFRSSIEALARRAIKNAPLSIGISAVDVYNAVSLEALTPLGAYDAARLPQGGLHMRRADVANDQFNPLGGTAADFPLHNALVVYATGNKVLCWGFNCRDSQETCLSETTDEAIFFGEAAFAIQHAGLQQAMSRMKSLLSDAGAACGEIQTASGQKQTFAV